MSDGIYQIGLMVFCVFVGLGSAWIPLMTFGIEAALFVYVSFAIGSYVWLRPRVLDIDERADVSGKVAEVEGEC